MARGTITIPLAVIGVAALIASGLLRLQREYDGVMFVSKPCDRVALAEPLSERFGTRVNLIGVPIVNRDVNGIAGLVRGGPPGLYRTDKHTFSFERLDGRDVCLMTIQPWELAYLRGTFLDHFREGR